MEHCFRRVISRLKDTRKSAIALEVKENEKISLCLKHRFAVVKCFVCLICNDDDRKRFRGGAATASHTG